MKVKQKVLDLVNNVESRKRISDDLKIGDQMLYKHMNQNKDNGRLTKMDAIIALSRESKIPVSKILEGNEELVSKS